VTGLLLLTDPLDRYEMELLLLDVDLTAVADIGRAESSLLRGVERLPSKLARRPVDVGVTGASPSVSERSPELPAELCLVLLFGVLPELGGGSSGVVGAVDVDGPDAVVVEDRESDLKGRGWKPLEKPLFVPSSLSFPAVSVHRRTSFSASSAVGDRTVEPRVVGPLPWVAKPNPLF
jgi:hypothetical protein